MIEVDSLEIREFCGIAEEDSDEEEFD